MKTLAFLVSIFLLGACTDYQFSSLSDGEGIDPQGKSSGGSDFIFTDDNDNIIVENEDDVIDGDSDSSSDDSDSSSDDVVNIIEDIDDIPEEYLCGNNQQKVLICHVPPGNSAAEHNICIAFPALQAHLGKHDNNNDDSTDYLGTCDSLKDIF